MGALKLGLEHEDGFLENSHTNAQTYDHTSTLQFHWGGCFKSTKLSRFGVEVYTSIKTSKVSPGMIPTAGSHSTLLCSIPSKLTAKTALMAKL